MGGKTRESGKPGDLPESSVPHNLRGKVQERQHYESVFVQPCLSSRRRGFFILQKSFHIVVFLVVVIFLGDARVRVYAQTDSTAIADSSSIRRSYSLSEVVVTATRNQTLSAVAPSAVSILTFAQIATMPGSLLSSALGTSAGLFVRSYGGGSALQTVSLRGMGAEHTLVLVDGQRYNNLQNGQTDFGLFSNSNVERVEIVRGGYSALYGADAVGGVINIITKKPDELLTGYIHTTLGSNSFSANEIALSGSEPAAGGLGYRMLVRREQGRGNYEFEFSDGQSTSIQRRNGEDFASMLAVAKLNYAFSSDVRSTLDISYSGADRGVGGPVTDLQANGTARMSDVGVRSQVSLEWSLSPHFSATCRSQFTYSYKSYQDPHLLIDGSPLDSYYVNRTVFVTPELQLRLSPAMTGNAGLEIMRGWIESNEVLEKVRWQRSAFISTQHIFPLATVTPFEVALYPSIRYDRFSDVAADVSPKLGINVGVLKEPELRVRSSYGKSFRVPTFNDLYWKEGGNPGLRPERSLSLDVGVVSSIRLFGMLHLELNYFSIDTRDRIVWTPGAGGVWSPKNFSAVESKGIEAEARWAGFDGAVSLTLNSTWMNTTKQSEDYPGDPTNGKQLIYIPRQMVNATGAIRFEPLTFFVQQSWISFRYTTEVNDRFLPHYMVTLAAVKYSLQAGPLTLSTKLEITNLFNASYQVIALYPMPLREFRGTLGVEL